MVVVRYVNNRFGLEADITKDAATHILDELVHKVQAWDVTVPGGEIFRGHMGRKAGTTDTWELNFGFQVPQNAVHEVRVQWIENIPDSGSTRLKRPKRKAKRK